MMKMDKDLVSLKFVSTTREQALLENELFPLSNFEHHIQYNEQQLIQVNQESAFRQVLAILSGDLVLDSGSIKVEGTELNHHSAVERNKILHGVIGLINFEERLIPYRTVLENLYAGFRHLPANSRHYHTHIQALLNWYHLDSVQHSFPKDCSPKQIVDLLFLRAFVHQPKLVTAFIPLNVPLLSIRQLTQLAKASKTSLLLFLQLDAMNERKTLITGQLVRDTIVK